MASEDKKTIKFQVSYALWERFFRLYPGHGERADVLRRVVRQLVKSGGQDTLSEDIAKKVSAGMAETREDKL